MPAIAIGAELALLLLAVLWPPFFVLLTSIADWRAFAPGTGPHRWERALYPSGPASRRAIGKDPRLPPPLPFSAHAPTQPREHRATKAMNGTMNVLKIIAIMSLASIGAGLLADRLEVALGTLLLLGAAFLFRAWVIPK